MMRFLQRRPKCRAASFKGPYINKYTKSVAKGPQSTERYGAKAKHWKASVSSAIVYPLGLTGTEQRVLYSAVTNEPFSFVEEKVINGIRHARHINQKTGDVLLLSEESLKLRFTSEKKNC